MDGQKADGLTGNSSSAAELVLRERERERTRRSRSNRTTPAAPKLEKVSAPSLGAAANVDERELERRQRTIHEQLERRQEEIRRTGQELARVRAELAELEAPIKADIMKLREKLEASNRIEKSLVSAVNNLRTELFEKEKKLSEVRETKQSLSDELIKTMADYEKRKSERLEQIAHLVGDTTPSTEQKPNGKPAFSGF